MIAMPYVLAAAVAVGAAGGAIAAWKWQEAEINRLELSNVRFEAAARVAEQIAQREAAQSEAQIAQILLVHARQEPEQEVVYVETIREVEKVASRTAQCLSPRVVRRLLDNNPSRGAPAENIDPLVSLGLATGSAPDTDGPGTSEAGIATWITGAKRQYSALHAKHKALAAIVRTLPGVVIE